MRVDDIRRAIEEMPSEQFERFAVELARRDQFPGLIPTSPAHDLGEDARTSHITHYLYGDEHVSLAASKTASLDKIREDCDRCLETGRTIDVLVFVTSGHPRRDTQESWRHAVEAEYPWKFDTLTIEWLAPTAARPEYESLVFDYLRVPPPGGDYLANIKRKFAACTSTSLPVESPQILGNHIHHPQLQQVENLLNSSGAVLLLGGPGTGKSGIAYTIATDTANRGQNVLLIDARQTAGLNTRQDLRGYVDLNGGVEEALQRLAAVEGCLLVIDQLDSVAGTPSAELLTTLARGSAGRDGVRVLVVMRAGEDSRQTIEALNRAGFQAVHALPLNETTANEVLSRLGIAKAPPALVELGRTLINLDLIARIHAISPHEDLAAVDNTVALWREYFQVVEMRESVGASADAGRELRAEAVALAWKGFTASERTVSLPINTTRTQRRLLEWGILVQDYPSTRIYRFRHEQVHDYLVAEDAFANRLDPQELMAAANAHRMTGVAAWLSKLYRLAEPAENCRFLRLYLDASSSVPFFSQAAILSEYLHIDVTSEDADVVRSILTAIQRSPGQRRFFFDAVPHASWANHLWKYDFFKEPPAPWVDEQGRALLSQWDVQRYLVAVAPAAPDTVMQHAMTLTAEGWYLGRALEAVCTIRTKQALPVAPRIATWLADSQVADRIEHQAYKLMLAFAEAGAEEAAFMIFAAMVAPRQPALSRKSSIWSHPADWSLQSDYYELFGQELEKLRQLNIERLATILENSLRILVSRDAPPGSYKAQDAHWRAAIEDTDQDHTDSPADKLLVALRDTLQVWIDSAPQSACLHVEAMLDDDYVIFKRLAIHMVAYAPAVFGAPLARLLLDARNYEDSSIHHEFFQLLHQGFLSLSAAHQSQVIHIIRSGFSEERQQWILDRISRTPNLQPEEDLLLRERLWIRDRLFVIQEHLGAEDTLFLKQLIGELGEPERPDFLSWHYSTTWVQPVSPLAADEIRQMPQDVLVRFLISWTPPQHTTFDQEMSRPTLAGAVAAALFSDIGGQQPKIRAVAEIEPLFAGAMLSHLANKNEMPVVPWPMSVELCELVLRQVPPVETEGEDHETPRVEVLMAVLRLLERGLEQGNELPIQQRPQVRAMLMTLANDPDHNPNEVTDDLLTLSLNRVRPQAVALLIRYGMQEAFDRQHAVASNAGDNSRNLKLDDELRELLAQKLDVEQEPSGAVRSVFGQYLAWLYQVDPEWTSQQLDRILPDSEEPGQVKMFAAAWDGYVRSARYLPQRDLLAKLRPKLLRAIKNLAGGFTTQYLEPERGLARMVVWEYLKSDYSVQSDPESRDVAVVFFQTAPPRVRAQAGWAAWQACSQAPQAFWPRLQMLWNWRATCAVQAADPRDFADEMSYFAQLPKTVAEFVRLDAIQLSLKTTLTCSLHSDQGGWGLQSIEEYLALRVEHEPAQVIAFLGWISDVAPIRQYAEPNETRRRILIGGAENPQSRQATLDLIDKLGRAGIHSYRDIYYQYYRSA